MSAPSCTFYHDIETILSISYTPICGQPCLEWVIPQEQVSGLPHLSSKKIVLAPKIDGGTWLFLSLKLQHIFQLPLNRLVLKEVSVENAILFSALQKAPHLKVFESSNPKEFPALMRTISTHCVKLNQLILSQIYSNEVCDFSSFENFENFQDLTLINNRVHILEQGLEQWLSGKGHTILSLNFYRSLNFSDIHVKIIASHCHQLRSFNIGNCSLITHASLYALNQCSSLKILCLENFQLEYRHVKENYRLFANLEELNLNESALTTETFLELGKSLKNIKKMHLYKCNAANLFMCLSSILPQLSTLIFLDIRECGLTMEEYALLGESSPQTQMIHEIYSRKER